MMTRQRLSSGAAMPAILAVLACSASAYEPIGIAGPPLPPQYGTLNIATGPDSNVDGFLSVAPDDYGSWASSSFGGGGDMYNPVGGFAASEVAFTSGLFLFTPNGRELLSDSTNWQNVLSADATLNRSVTSPLSGMDTNSDGVFDTLTSSFDVFGASVDLQFDLTQRVDQFGGGVSFIEQTYVISNSGPDVSLNLVRAFDGDLLWSGDFGDDEVGTNMHGAGQGPFVFQQEVTDPTTAMTLSSPSAQGYYGGKNGVLPPTPPGGVAYAYGTDVQVWDAFGVPSNWLNHIAGVGYDTDGTSGAMPPGSITPADGFIGLSEAFELAQGQARTLTFLYTYGANNPAPEPATIGMLAIGTMMLRRRRRRG